jgi:hypothetical protein
MRPSPISAALESWQLVKAHPGLNKENRLLHSAELGLSRMKLVGSSLRRK